MRLIKLTKVLFIFLVCFTTIDPVSSQNSDKPNNAIEVNTTQCPQITSVYNRISYLLNGEWNYIIDQHKLGYARKVWENKVVENKSQLLEYNFNNADKIQVPGSWNMQSKELFYYEGQVWYQKAFDFDKKENKRYFLNFGAVNYEAEVYLNGLKLGGHKGGFNPFTFEITETLQENENALIIRVSNRREAEQIPSMYSDWKNFGGITRDVQIIEEDQSFIRDFTLQLQKDKNNVINFEVIIDGNLKEENVKLSIPELGISKTVKTTSEGFAKASIEHNKIELWSPENPKLYHVEFELNGKVLSDKIGFRTIQVKDGEILLNNEALFLKGICLHEENPETNTRTNSKVEAKRILNTAKELNSNYLRLSHYPHNEHIVRLADEMGIMLWEEIPVYGDIDFKNPATFALSQDMLNDLITRDKNRASVIIWSMANETKISDERNTFLKKLIDFTREKDDTRLISVALLTNKERSTETVKVVDDPFGKNVDIISANQYSGWYGGTPDIIKNIKWQIEYDKPFVFSEFGAGALQGFHADSLTIWSEEYQEWYYKETLKMCNSIEKLRGISPWILFDFQSPKRQLKPYQNGFNRKGIISSEGVKKKAFYVLQDFYKNK